MTTIQPQLWVDLGRTAVEFYTTAFGARVTHLVGEGEDIVAQMAVDGAMFWVAAAGRSDGRLVPRLIGGSATARFLLVVDDPDTVFDRAVAIGATATSDVADEHGWRVGRLTDPFGHEWEIGKPVGVWPPPESSHH